MAAVENIMEFDLDNVNGVQYCDLNQCMSLMSRKLERQGQQVVVQNIEFISTEPVELNIYRLPVAWYAVNAWVKAYSVWQRQQHEALDEQESTKAKWRDFKVHVDQNHLEITKLYDDNGVVVPVGGTSRTGFACNLLPTWGQKEIQGVTGAITVDLAQYEWEASQVIRPSNELVDEEIYDLKLLGDDDHGGPNYCYGIIHGYATSRARPNSPDPNVVNTTGTDRWMTEIFDVGGTLGEAADAAAEYNDEPPYIMGAHDSGLSGGKEYYPGGAEVAGSITNWPVDQIFLGLTPGHNGFAVGSTGSFIANLGLIYITQTSTTNRVKMRVTIATDQKGNYLTRPMKEAN